jgi:two-component system, chemotaxis family, sensor kinase CheA
MDDYINDFLEEVTELTDGLEKNLIQLEENRSDKGLITRIFRAMHTLKGSSGMFGFGIITDFTHNLETIFELLRDGQIELSDELLNISFASVDHIKNLLKDPELKVEKNKITHQALTTRIDTLANEMGLNGIFEAIEKAKQSNQIVSQISDFKTYYIRFEAFDDINILFLFGELQTLGKSKIIPRFKQIPPLSQLNHEKCYIYWDIFISTNCSEKEISNVFIFVENPKIEISLMSENDLFEDIDFINKLEDSKRSGDLSMFENIEAGTTKLKQEEVVLTAEVKTDRETVNTEKTRTVYKEPQTVKNIIEPIEDLTNQYLNDNKPQDSENDEVNTSQGEQTSGETIISSIRVASSKIDEIMNLVSELITTQARLNLVLEDMKTPALASVTRNFQKLIRELRDKAFSLSLLPIESMLTRFHRLVRDLSKKVNKEIVFHTEGTETELDKILIQSLADPLMHIIRNCIDHGIEDEETRARLGKPKEGLIILQAFYSGAHVFIQITDDGAGINPQVVKEKAIEKGLVNPNGIYSKKDMLNMVFLPGLSTAQKLTDISGRGVGMDVVKKKVEDVRGEVEVDSEIDQGTTVTIKLPLTLSIVDGLLVYIGTTKYIIQLSVVQKIYRIKSNQLNEYTNLVVLENQQIPFHYLRREFDVQGDVPEEMKIVVVGYENRKIGLVVDDVIGEYQAVLKPLGKLYEHIEIISGGTVLGDGIVALVLDTSKLIKMFANEM